MNTTTIPKIEFIERIKKFQTNIKKEGLDACLAHATESDLAFVRYLSEYWPVFETAAVFVPAEGEPILLVGPESDLYASHRSFFTNIEKMIEYRESAEPDAPGMSFITYKDLLTKYHLQHIKKLGIVGWAITSLPVYMSLQEQLPDVEIVKADMTLWPLRFVKSENELACEGLRLSDLLRWRSHNIFTGFRPIGMKFIQSDFPDMMIGTNVYLDQNGYIDPYQKSLPLGYGFKPERDYLYPIPSVEFTLNSSLSQNPGWDK